MSKECPITCSSWTLGDQCTFEERVVAASKAGFEGIGLRAENYVDALEEGWDDESMLFFLADRNIRVTEVEDVVSWADKNRTYEEKYKEQICFHMCQVFGVKHVNCALMEHVDEDYATKKLKALCERANHIQIALEFMPYSGIEDVEQALRMMDNCGQDNVGLLLDFWHWMRAGLPLDFAYVHKIPKEKILSVQVNDVQKQPYAPSVMRAESLHDRLAPDCFTKGSHLTSEFCRLLHDEGIKPYVLGIEVINDHMLSKGLDYMASYTYQKTVEVLNNTWPEILA